MTSSPDETLLLVVDSRADRARRRRLALGLALVWIAAVALVLKGGLVDLTWSFWALPLLVGALLLAWRAGLFERTRALLQLGSIRRDGLRASEKLGVGDVEGAKQGYAALLPRARSLGAFHATHVLMYGLTRYLEGDAPEGLKLIARALDSGWFDGANMRQLREVGQTWRILVLLDLGQLAEARSRLGAQPGDRRARGRRLRTALGRRRRPRPSRPRRRELSSRREADDRSARPPRCPANAARGAGPLRGRPPRRAARGAGETEPRLSKVPLSASTARPTGPLRAQPCSPMP
jgi:hypothetical protein